jgi:hypothetical protein
MSPRTRLLFVAFTLLTSAAPAAALLTLAPAADAQRIREKNKLDCNF